MAQRRASVPAGLRVYAFGDVHGRADLLDQILDMIDRDRMTHPSAARPIVVGLGDYIDRGPDSRAVIEHLAGRLPHSVEWHFLMGNHEHALLRFLDDPEAHKEWLAIGGAAMTALSYGVDSLLGMPRSARARHIGMALQEALPARHMAFLRGLELSYRVGGYLFVHAGLRPGVPIAWQSAEDMLWIRRPFLNYCGDFGAMVVHGHSTNLEPVLTDNRIGIDTGAYATNVLTCLVLEGSQRRFLATGTCSTRTKALSAH